ncbi:MAG: winged helix-turn-helix transcriptional regulator [Polyangiaceae bacterium]
MPSSNTLEFLLFSGEYNAVLERTAASQALSEMPAMVGALALSGRLDEAESAFARLTGTSGVDPEFLAQARFFVVAGLCHAGRIPRALRVAQETLPQVRGGDSRRRFWACQGFALIRYFQGRFHLARRFARRALNAAIECAFPYARFLALDLCAHISVQTGEVFAGLRLMEQAQALADALGYQANAATLRVMRTVYELRFLVRPVDEAIQRATQTLDSEGVSYFGRRNGLIELANMQTLRGHFAAAQETLESARRIALPGNDRRGKTRWALAMALYAALVQGEGAEHLEVARASGSEELMLQAELAFVEAVFFPELARAHSEEIAKLAVRTGIQRARVAATFATQAPIANTLGVEDGLSRALLQCHERSEPARRVQSIVETGLLGLLPWALGRAPSQRIVVTASSVLSETSRGITLAELPSRPSLRVLFALREGYQSRERLLESIWGITRFVPQRHVPVLHTAVSRLRVALGDGEWVLTLDDGYSLASDVEVLDLGGLHVPGAPATSPPPPPSDAERVLEYLRNNSNSSSSDVATALSISASAALRLLRRLTEEGEVTRQGGGRSTRYSLAPPKEAS